MAIYSTFLQRGYDQLIHDVALQDLPVAFAIDRAGIVGADGATHMGAFDLAYLRCIPNLVVMAASDENECRQMLHTAVCHEGPCAVRYPRGNGPGVTAVAEMVALPIGKGEIAVMGAGRLGSAWPSWRSVPWCRPVWSWPKRSTRTVADMRFIRPLDETLVRQLALSHDLLVTVEEGCLKGGAVQPAWNACPTPASVCRVAARLA